MSATVRPAYYNEIDPYAAAWLRNLIAAGHIAPGEVDERSIVDVRPSDLDGFGQCHFFAGVGGWSLAFRMAGVLDDEPVWTGSCPCQPFSAAGKQGGFDDARHLWPEMFRLIAECRPAIVFGEQVESAVRLGWLDAVFGDLEGANYACGAVVLGAHSVGAPHIRQRLWWVADAGRAGLSLRECGQLPGTVGLDQGRATEQRGRASGGVGLANGDGRDQGQPAATPTRHGSSVVTAGCPAGDMADTDHNGLQGSEPAVATYSRRRSPDPLRSPWSHLEWPPCRDGKWRPTQPGLFPLAHGAPARVGKLRAAGNAIVPQVAATFIEAVMDVTAPVLPIRRPA